MIRLNFKPLAIAALGCFLGISSFADLPDSQVVATVLSKAPINVVIMPGDSTVGSKTATSSALSKTEFNTYKSDVTNQLNSVDQRVNNIGGAITNLDQRMYVQETTPDVFNTYNSYDNRVTNKDCSGVNACQYDTNQNVTYKITNIAPPPPPPPPPPADVYTTSTETRVQSCLPGQTGKINQSRQLSYKNGVLYNTGSWTDTMNTCQNSVGTYVETQNLQCPAGQGGNWVQSRTVTTTNGVPAYSAWQDTTNTCAQQETFTERFETQTLACPAGSTGQITETRKVFVSSLGRPDTYSPWAQTANTCVAAKGSWTKQLYGMRGRLGRDFSYSWKQAGQGNLDAASATVYVEFQSFNNNYFTPLKIGQFAGEGSSSYDVSNVSGDLTVQNNGTYKANDDNYQSIEAVDGTTPIKVYLRSSDLTGYCGTGPLVPGKYSIYDYNAPIITDGVLTGYGRVELDGQVPTGSPFVTTTLIFSPILDGAGNALDVKVNATADGYFNCGSAYQYIFQTPFPTF